MLSWLSLMTSLMPRGPRRVRLRRNSVQNGPASLAPTFIPCTCRWPSVLTATATITATLTMRPASRVFTYVASIHKYGQSPSMGRSRKALTRSSSSSHSRLISLLEKPLIPSALTRSSTERVDTSCT